MLLATNGIMSLSLWQSNIPLHIYVCVFVYHIFIHSCVRHLGCFYVLATVSSAFMNINVHAFFFF